MFLDKVIIVRMKRLMLLPQLIPRQDKIAKKRYVTRILRDPRYNYAGIQAINQRLKNVYKLMKLKYGTGIIVNRRIVY